MDQRPVSHLRSRHPAAEAGMGVLRLSWER